MSESTLTNNRTFAENDRRLRVACGLAGISPTKRQASKFRRGLGRAHSAMLVFLGGGYDRQREALLVNLNKTKKELELKSAQLKEMPESSKEAKEISKEIETLKSRVESTEAELNRLKNTFETLRG